MSPSPIDGRLDAGAHDEDRNAGDQAVDINAGGAQRRGSDVVRSRLVAVGRGLGVAGLNRTSAASRSCPNFLENYVRSLGAEGARGPQMTTSPPSHPVSTRRKSGHNGSPNRSDFPTRCPTVAPDPLAPAKHCANILKYWCRLQDSNPRPTDYKSVALPAELNRRLDVGLSIRRRASPEKSAGGRLETGRPVSRRYEPNQQF